MPKRRLPHGHLGEQWIFEDSSDLAIKGEPIHKRVRLRCVNSSGGGLIFYRGRPLDKVRKVLAMPTLQVSWMQRHLPSKQSENSRRSSVTLVRTLRPHYHADLKAFDAKSKIEAGKVSDENQQV